MHSFLLGCGALRCQGVSIPPWRLLETELQFEGLTSILRADRSCLSGCWRRIGRQAAGESVGESEDRGREGGVPASSGHHGRKQRGTWRGGGGSGGARGLPCSNGCCWTGGASRLADAPEVSCQVILGMLSGADQTHAALRAPHLPGRHLAQGCCRLEKALSLARPVTDHHWM